MGQREIFNREFLQQSQSSGKLCYHSSWLADFCCKIKRLMLLISQKILILICCQGTYVENSSNQYIVSIGIFSLFIFISTTKSTAKRALKRHVFRCIEFNKWAYLHHTFLSLIELFSGVRSDAEIVLKLGQLFFFQKRKSPPE